MIDEVGNVVDAVYYNKHQSDNGALVHSGDNISGDKQGYDETITINLPAIHFTVSYFAVLVTNANGTGFGDSKNSFVSIWQGATLMSEIHLGTVPEGNNS